MFLLIMQSLGRWAILSQVVSSVLDCVGQEFQVHQSRSDENQKWLQKSVFELG